MSWKEKAKCISKAFQKLRLKKNGGFWAKQRHTCCNTCGWAEAPNMDNIVFYHIQDWDYFKEYKELYLSYKGNTDKIVKVFEEEGLNVNWNGDTNTKIIIY
jgi:hypothetical protein